MKVQVAPEYQIKLKESKEIMIINKFLYTFNECLKQPREPAERELMNLTLNNTIFNSKVTSTTSAIYHTVNNNQSVTKVSFKV